MSTYALEAAMAAALACKFMLFLALALASPRLHAQHAYVTNNYGNTISAYGVSASHTLAPIGVVPTGNPLGDPLARAVDLSTRFVYAANPVAGKAAAYRIELYGGSAG